MRSRLETTFIFLLMHSRRTHVVFKSNPTLSVSRRSREDLLSPTSLAAVGLLLCGLSWFVCPITGLSEQCVVGCVVGFGSRVVG